MHLHNPSDIQTYLLRTPVIRSPMTAPYRHVMVALADGQTLTIAREWLKEDGKPDSYSNRTYELNESSQRATQEFLLAVQADFHAIAALVAETNGGAPTTMSAVEFIGAR